MRICNFGKALCFALAACSSDGSAPDETPSGAERLSARPQAGVATAAPGDYSFSVVGAASCCTLRVPAGAKQPVPLVVMLHGANGTPDEVAQIVALADTFGYAVLAPRSRGRTWDGLLEGFGADVVVIDKALTETFTRVNVDPHRIAVAGFSDGASYALSLGLANGDLFTHVIAFSPGFMAPVVRVGKPLFFIAHGRSDGVTPFLATVDNFIPFLKFLGYDVRFDAFNGAHQINDTEAHLASQWFTQQ